MTQSRKSYTRQHLRAIALLAAGATSGVIMQEHPKIVLPTERILGALDALLENVTDAELDEHGGVDR